MTPKELRELKAKIGMTWHEMAQATGYHVGMLWRMASGRRKITIRAEKALKNIKKPIDDLPNG